MLKHFRLHCACAAGFASVALVGASLWMAAPPTDYTITSIAQPFEIDPTFVASINVPTAGSATNFFHDEDVSLPHLRGGDFENDRSLQEAARIAQLTKAKFNEAFTQWDGGAFSVKTFFSDHGRREAIWVTVKELKDGGYLGVLAEKPKNLSSITKGHTVHIRDNAIVDWMIQSNQAIYGAYTTRIALSRRADAEALEILNLMKDL